MTAVVAAAVSDNVTLAELGEGGAGWEGAGTMLVAAGWEGAGTMSVAAG